MTQSTAMILFFLGLIFTMFGVGGVENSITNTELFSALAVSVLGLGLMYVSTLAMRVSDYYGE
jgi:hypothetical protein